MNRSILPPRVALAARRCSYFLHLWTGLLLGLYFVLMGVTGSLLLFENEMDAAMNRSLFVVQAPAGGATSKPLDDLVGVVTQRYPGSSINSVTLPQSPTESLRIGYAPAAAVGATPGRGMRREAFVDPYTGAFLGARTTGGAFFPKVLQLHREFLLRDVGAMLNRYGVLFLIVLLISGIWLWFPSVHDFWRKFRQRTTVQRGASAKRLLFDLHNMVGFYASLLLLVITVTAASYFWKAPTVTIVSALTNTPMVPQEGLGNGPGGQGGPGGFGGRGGRQRRGGEPNPGNNTPPQSVSYATLMANANKVFPKLPVLQISRGGRGGGRGGRGGGLRVIKAEPAAYGVRPRLITLTMDPSDGSITGTDLPDQSPLGIRVMNWLMPIHEGQWGYGVFFYVVKTLHCLAGLSPILLFVTGFFMWLNKRRAKIGNRQRAASKVAISAKSEEREPVVS